MNEKVLHEKNISKMILDIISHFECQGSLISLSLVESFFSFVLQTLKAFNLH